MSEETIERVLDTVKTALHARFEEFQEENTTPPGTGLWLVPIPLTAIEAIESALAAHDEAPAEADWKSRYEESEALFQTYKNLNAQGQAALAEADAREGKS